MSGHRHFETTTTTGYARWRRLICIAAERRFIFPVKWQRAPLGSRHLRVITTSPIGAVILRVMRPMSYNPDGRIGGAHGTGLYAFRIG